MTAEVAESNPDAQTAPPMLLRAGPLTLRFEPKTGFLRGIRLGEREVVRAIYGAVRDANWGTVAPQISNLCVDAHSNSFTLTFDALCREREIVFRWRGAIEGEPNGTVQFTMTGEAESTFLRNRIGLCVLHPIRETAGEMCRVETDRGEIFDAVFPDRISPHQPFFNLRALSHAVTPDLWAEVRFEGETFEMEDQRNWTDASFKTYGTPLALPFPVEISAGTQVVQTVTLALHGSDELAFHAAPNPDIKDEANTSVIVTVGAGPEMALPALGLGMASHNHALTPDETARLRALNLSHLRVDIVAGGQDAPTRLRQAVRQAQELDTCLEVALFLSDAAEAELAGLAEALTEALPRVVRWLVFHKGEKSTPERTLHVARKWLSSLAPAIPLVAGTNAYFAELNRERPPINLLDGVCWSINPQVHATDDASLMENLEAQNDTVRSAEAFAPGLPLVISPVTLRPRFNPNATGPEPAHNPDTLPAAVDVRQTKLIGASWTLGSLDALCRSGVHSLTYYGTTGWRGVMESAAGSPWPSRYASQLRPGTLFPLYHVFADVGAFRDGKVLPAEVSSPGRIAALALTRNGQSTLLLANLTSEPQGVRIVLPPDAVEVRWRVVSAEKEAELANAPELFRQNDGERLLARADGIELQLPAWAYARLVWTTQEKTNHA